MHRMGVLARQFWMATPFELLLYAFIAKDRCGEDCSLLGLAFSVTFIYVSVRLVIIAASFVVTGIAGSPRPKGYRIGPIQAAWMFLEEYLTSLLTFSVLQPLESWLGLRDPPSTAKRSKHPILLVHGFVGNGGVWWGLRRRLLQIGFNDVYTINLEPTSADIEDLAGSLGARVDEILRDSESAKITLVCHSMGGLVSRFFVERLGGSDRVRGIITLGTPHHGTSLARLLGGANVCQMRRNSGWLDELNAAGSGTPETPLISIYSYHDNIVCPQESSRLEWAENLPFAGLGHMALLYSPRSQAAVIRVLQRLWIRSSG